MQGQIHAIPNILLRNREDLVNFDQFLKVDNLYRECCKFFFKVADFLGIENIICS